MDPTLLPLLGLYTERITQSFARDSFLPCPHVGLRVLGQQTHLSPIQDKVCSRRSENIPGRLPWRSSG